MMLVESKLTADPAVVNALKEAGDIETAWATVTLSINNTAYDERQLNLLGVIDYFTAAVGDGIVTPSDAARKFNELCHRGEATFQSLAPKTDPNDEPYAVAIMEFGALTEKGKAMTETERAEAMAQRIIELTVGKAEADGLFDGAFDGIIDVTDEKGD